MNKIFGKSKYSIAAILFFWYITDVHTIFVIGANFSDFWAIDIVRVFMSQQNRI